MGWKKITVRFFVCITILFSILFCIEQYLKSKAFVTRYIQNNILELEDYVGDIIDSGEIHSKSFYKWDVAYYPAQKMVQFTVASGGFASSHWYKGFYYSQADKPLGFQGAELNFDETAAGWEWNETDGDNNEYTERITANWYWFEMNF